MKESAASKPVDTLRISITDRCNLRCRYCMPAEGVPWIPHAEILSYEEILRVVRACARLGVRKLRVTGGEPLVRKGVVELVESLSRVDGIQDLCMTTNGVLLERFVPAFRRAGLRRVTVSLDSLQTGRYRDITGSDRLEEVLSGIRASLEGGLSPVKINVVLIRGLNDDEVVDFARLSLSHPLEVRFIERMPVGHPDSRKSCGDWGGETVSAKEVLERIRKAFGALEPAPPAVPVPGPARLYRLPGGNGRVGVISAVTTPFCDSCTRVRLTPEGGLRNCLFREESCDLKGLLRAGASDGELLSVLRAAIARKSRLTEAPFDQIRKPMCQIGG
ncbi:MAG: GTP 3',8-cyclase MoaA [bacterium]